MIPILRLVVLAHLAAFVAGLSSSTSAFRFHGTATELRSRTSDGDYKINLDDGINNVDGTDVFKQTANFSRFGILNAADVQSSMERFMLRPGTNLSAHSHPRAAELMYVEAGRIAAWVHSGGSFNDTTFKVDVGRFGVAIFPQGMLHGGGCVSDGGCILVSYYTSADAGTVYW